MGRVCFFQRLIKEAKFSTCFNGTYGSETARFFGVFFFLKDFFGLFRLWSSHIVGCEFIFLFCTFNFASNVACFPGEHVHILLLLLLLLLFVYLKKKNTIRSIRIPRDLLFRALMGWSYIIAWMLRSGKLFCQIWCSKALWPSHSCHKTETRTALREMSNA